MRSFPLARCLVALIAWFVAVAQPVLAGSAADSTGAQPGAARPSSPHYAAAGCAAGYRIATIVRFPIGIGLGLAVCVAGITLELDARLHRATD